MRIVANVGFRISACCTAASRVSTVAGCCPRADAAKPRLIAKMQIPRGRESILIPHVLFPMQLVLLGCIGKFRRRPTLSLPRLSIPSRRTGTEMRILRIIRMIHGKKWIFSTEVRGHRENALKCEMPKLHLLREADWQTCRVHPWGDLAWISNQWLAHDEECDR